jgi:hypothetical protein
MLERLYYMGGIDQLYLGKRALIYTHSYSEEIPIFERNLTLPRRFIYGVSVPDEVGCSLSYGILERGNVSNKTSFVVVITVYLPTFPLDVPRCCSARIRSQVMVYL